jgi:enhancing lycopene biosynthesis protein 2
MAKRVGVILSGCGRRDGSDPIETALTLLVIERAGAVAVCAAPDGEQTAVVDHLAGTLTGLPRNVRSEAARLVGLPVLPLGALDAGTIDALVIPGGEGALTLLSNYADKHELCQVEPEIARLLRALLAAHRTMGFIGLSALLAARVLGPVAGVRVTLGPRGTLPSKHAAIMGADVRPCTADDDIADQKARVYTTPGFLVEGARLAGVARAIDRVVRAVVGGARDRAPAPVVVGAPAGERGPAVVPRPAPPDNGPARNSTIPVRGMSSGQPTSGQPAGQSAAPPSGPSIEPRRRSRGARRY